MLDLKLQALCAFTKVGKPTHTHVYTHPLTHARSRARAHTHTHTHRRVRTHIHRNTHMHTHVCTCAHTHTSMNVHRTKSREFCYASVDGRVLPNLSLFKGMSNEDRFKTSEDDYVIVLSPENFVMPLLMDEFYQICHFSKECQMTDLRLQMTTTWSYWVQRILLCLCWWMSSTKSVTFQRNVKWGPIEDFRGWPRQ